MTMPEPSPLPRFGIRHLLGLTAALAVAMTMLRGELLGTYHELTSNADASLIWFRYRIFFGHILDVTSLAVNLFLAVYLLVWSHQFCRWKFQPGHYVALAAIVERVSYAALKPILFATVSQFSKEAVYGWFSLYSVVVAVIYSIGIKRSQLKRWRLVLVLLLGNTVNTLVWGVFIFFLTLRIDLRIARIGLLTLGSLALVSAIVIDLRTRTNWHWSHWWAVTICLISVSFDAVRNWIIYLT